MQSLERKLASVLPENTQETYKHLLSRTCGDTCFENYNTGRLPAKVTLWTNDVNRTVRDLEFASDDYFEALFDCDARPYATLVFALRRLKHQTVVLRDASEAELVSHEDVLSRKEEPLIEIATALQQSIVEQWPNSRKHLVRFCNCLEHTNLGDFIKVANCPSRTDRQKYETDRKTYANLQNTAAGQTRLMDFETDELANDISGWTFNVRRVIDG